MNPSMCGPIRTTADLTDFVDESLKSFGSPSEHVLVIIPDDTRTIPMPELYGVICGRLASRVRKLTFLIALGTHPPMTAAQLDLHLGAGWRRPDVTVSQHDWKDPSGLIRLGSIPASELEDLSGGLLSETVPVTINRLAVEVDRILIVNPVFPHEVVGFSGGHKYFFPGVSGTEVLNSTHWLGALITNPVVNGRKNTPVRSLIERAAALVPTPRQGLSLVMKGHDPVGAYFGDVDDAWSAAADLSAGTNIVWRDASYHTVLSMAPPMYRELWTAGKCMYKLEPVVADGGKLIIFAPHLHEISPTHGHLIRQVGYHTRDFFLKQWDRYSGIPRAVLAHSTHVKGVGTFEDGVERPRVEVVLATGIPEKLCHEINLGYQDPVSLHPSEFENSEEDGILVVPSAGEMLYRLRSGSGA